MLEPELRDAFMAAVERAARQASQIVRELMREFFNQGREYIASQQCKVDSARTDIAARREHTQEEVAAHTHRVIADHVGKGREAAE